MRKLNTQDVFRLARLIRKADLKDSFKALFVKSKNMDGDTETKRKELGFDAVMLLIERASDELIEGDFYALIAGIAEREPQDIANMSLEALTELFKQISKENNIEVFFEAASRSAETLT